MFGQRGAGWFIPIGMETERKSAYSLNMWARTVSRYTVEMTGGAAWLKMM
jgi:hypothetical protein